MVLSVVAGWLFGARSLNAVAAPTLGALVAGAVVLARNEEPTVTLSSVDAGFPGESRTMTVSFSGTGLATVSLDMPEEIEKATDGQRITLPQTVDYELELAGRGIHSVGLSALVLRGPLGLLERRVEVEGTTDVTVYPQRYTVADSAVLAELFADELEAERQEFDRLREYQPGDPLRRIHWKSSAKHDEFLVAEFAPTERDETVTIVGTVPPGEIDEMARIAATIADLAFAADHSVEVATPTGHVQPGKGETHRESVLGLLARTSHGTNAPVGSEAADVEITYVRRELVVRVGTAEYSISEFLDRLGGAVETAVESSTAPEVTP
ncbi:DUF58 domain-containing protein [Halovenus salina]|uniref:DUF58 domain-containing protein n=1 Tax=Halovenus salina TaxID=1510225 RepID=A0ABD5VYJ8_9EURY|nr:DUF58 domain-containing protein [Halovenus salina]